MNIQTDKFSRASSLYEELKRDNLVKSKEISLSRLRANAEKKMKTTFIGCLDSVEKHLGFLWGHGRPDGDLTEEERDFRVAWDELREEILNKGNSQSRALQAEISEYEVLWKKKDYIFPLTTKEGTKDDQ